MSEWLIYKDETLRFIVTPEELKKCLKDFHLVINNAHVPLDYVETPIERV